MQARRHTRDAQGSGRGPSALRVRNRSQAKLCDDRGSTSLVADLKAKSKTFDQFVEDADIAVIDDAFRRAARGISPDLARTYVQLLARRKDNSDPPDEEAFVEARTDIAALGLVPEVSSYLDAEATKLANAWLDKHRIAIKNLPTSVKRLIDRSAR